MPTVLPSRCCNFRGSAYMYQGLCEHEHPVVIHKERPLHLYNLRWHQACLRKKPLAHKDHHPKHSRHPQDCSWKSLHCGSWSVPSVLATGGHTTTTRPPRPHGYPRPKTPKLAVLAGACTILYSALHALSSIVRFSLVARCSHRMLTSCLTIRPELKARSHRHTAIQSASSPP